MQYLWFYAYILLWIGCLSDSMMWKCSFTVFIPSRDVWGKKTLWENQFQTPLTSVESHFPGVSLLLRRRFEAGFQHAVAKKKHALNLNAPSSLSMFGIFGICFVKPHDCQFLIHPASIYILCSEYWVAFCWALHCPCSNFYPLVGMPWRPTVEQPEFLPWAGFGAQPSAIYIYVFGMLTTPHPMPPHATPTFVQKRAKRCPRFFGQLA